MNPTTFSAVVEGRKVRMGRAAVKLAEGISGFEGHCSSDIGLGEGSMSATKLIDEYR